MTFFFIFRYLGIEDNEIYSKDHAEIDCGERLVTLSCNYSPYDEHQSSHLRPVKR